MQDIIAWLQRVERLACDLYNSAAEFFQYDEALSAFLNRMSQEEAWHLHLVGSAGHYLRDNQLTLMPDVHLTSDTQAQVETPLRRASDLLAENALSRAQLLDLLLKAETSEWNTLFLYVINSLQQYSKRFQQLAVVVQQHEQYIESFVGTLPDGEQLLENVKKLPMVWEPQFLVVEPNAPICNLLQRLLRGRGTVQVAASGSEGLVQIAKHVFSVVVCDMQLPDMDGMTFYRQAISRDPDLLARFVFCLGYTTDDQWDFVRQNTIQYLEKPFNLQLVMQAVDAVLERSARDDNQALFDGKAT